MKKTLSLMIILCMLLLILPLQAAAFADTITLPDALRTIEAEAFMNDTSLETVVIPSTVTSIGSKAFAGSSATAVFISSSEITIEGDAFDQTATLYVSSDAAYNAAYGRFTYRDLRNTNFLMMTPHSNENDNIINGTRNDKAYMDFTATVRDGININTTEIQVLVSKNGNFDGTQGQDWWEIPPRAYSTETQEYRLAPSLTTYLKGILLDSSGNQLAESGVVKITTQDKDKDTDCPYYQHELVLNNGTVTADLIGPPYFWLETTGNGVYQFVTSGVENISITNQDGKFVCYVNEDGAEGPYVTEGSSVSSFGIQVDDGTSSLYLQVKRKANTASLTVTKESAVIPTNTLTMTPHSDENDHIINGTRNDTAYMDFTATVADGINIDETEIQVLVSLNENFEDYWKTLPHAYSTETQEYRLAPSLTAYLKGRLLDSNGTPLAESDAVKITTEDKTGADCPYNWKDKNGENHHKLVLNNGTVTADLIGPPYFWFETTGNGVYQFVASGVDDISITNQDGKFICRAYENGIDSPYDDAAGDIVSGFSIPIDGGTSSLYLRVKYKENTTASLTVTKEGAVIPTNTLTMTRHSDENDHIINGTRNDKAYMDFTATVANGIDINTTEIQVLVSLNKNFEGTQGRDWWETPSRPYSPETQEYRLAPSLTAYLKGILLDSSGNQLAESGVVEITTQDKNSADSPYNWSDENEANHHKLVLNNGTVTADLIGPPYFWFETTGNGVYRFVTSGVASISITNQDGKFICSANESGINSPYAGTEGSNVSSFSIPVDDGTSSLYLEVRKANNTASLTITKRS